MLRAPPPHLPRSCGGIIIPEAAFACVCGVCVALRCWTEGRRARRQHYVTGAPQQRQPAIFAGSGRHLLTGLYVYIPFGVELLLCTMPLEAERFWPASLRQRRRVVHQCSRTYRMNRCHTREVLLIRRCMICRQQAGLRRICVRGAGMETTTIKRTGAVRRRITQLAMADGLKATLWDPEAQSSAAVALIANVELVSAALPPRHYLRSLPAPASESASVMCEVLGAQCKYLTLTRTQHFCQRARHTATATASTQNYLKQCLSRSGARERPEATSSSGRAKS